MLVMRPLILIKPTLEKTDSFPKMSHSLTASENVRPRILHQVYPDGAEMATK